MLCIFVSVFVFTGYLIYIIYILLLFTRLAIWKISYVDLLIPNFMSNALPPPGIKIPLTLFTISL